MMRALRLLLLAGLLPLLWAPVSGAEAQAAPGLPGYPVEPQGYPSYESPYGASVTTQQASRLRSLDADLNLFGARSDGRFLDGSVSLVVGAVFATMSVFVDDALFRTLLILTGGIASTRGLTQLTLLPDAAQPVREFNAMPMLSASQIAARLTYGEQALARIARQTRRARLVDGSVAVVAASAYVPLYTLLRHAEHESFKYGKDPSDYVIIGFAAIALAAGLATLIVESEPERAVAAYGKLRDRLGRKAGAGRSLQQASMAPYVCRDGAGIAARLVF